MAATVPEDPRSNSPLLKCISRLGNNCTTSNAPYFPGNAQSFLSPHQFTFNGYILNGDIGTDRKTIIDSTTPPYPGAVYEVPPREGPAMCINPSRQTWATTLKKDFQMFLDYTSFFVRKTTKKNKNIMQIVYGKSIHTDLPFPFCIMPLCSFPNTFLKSSSIKQSADKK